MVTQLTRCSILAVVLLSAISDSLSISLSAVSLKFPMRLLKYLKKEACQWYLSVSQVSAVISWMFCVIGHEYINHTLRCVLLCPPSNSQAAECRVHDPTLFVPLLMVPNCYQAISKESSRQKQQGFSSNKLAVSYIAHCVWLLPIMKYYLWPNILPILLWRNLSLVYFGDISIS